MKRICITLVTLVVSVFLVYFSVMYIKNNLKSNESNETISTNVTTVDKEQPINNEDLISDNIQESDVENEVKNSEETMNKVSNNNNDNKYYIKVNYSQNVVTIYEKDSEGNYTIPAKAMICSTGTDTPRSGVYSIKYRWLWLGLFGDVYGYYVTQIVGDILFHSVPYLKKSPDTLEYWEYDKLGTSASLGCVRLKVIDAKWIYDNIPSGTKVEFYASNDPGPLGKPETQKISDNVECRNWDPTDPNVNNPWNKQESNLKEDEDSSEPVDGEQDIEIYDEKISIYTE